MQRILEMKRVILSGVLVLITIIGLSIGATGAFFSDTETSAANTFTAGAIDLKVDNESYYNGVFSEITSWGEKDLDEDDKFFNFLDLKPSDYGEDTISLHVDTNDAYLCANVTLTSNDDNGINEPEGEVDGTDGPGEGELADLVNFIWWADDGDNVLETDENVISQGPIGALTLGQSYPVVLADSETNIWNDDEEGGPVQGDTTLYIGKAWCFGDIEAAPLAQSDYDSPAGDNDGVNGAGQPEDGGYTCDGDNLGNESQTDTLTADIEFEAVQARHNDDFLCDRPALACEAVQAYADNVVDFDQGVRKNGTEILADRTDPNDALGAPQSSGTPFDNPAPAGAFFSLGFDEEEDDTEGGWIIVEFTDNVIVDGPGNDLRMWEVTGGTSYPVEKLKVEVSQDNITWHEVASSVDRDAEADLRDSGLTWAKYVRLTDVSNRAEFEETADGYDLDAFSALNCATGTFFPGREIDVNNAG